MPAEAHYNFGVCLAAQGKSADAADAFRMAIAVNPEHAGALSSLGQLAELEGRVEEAEASYRSAAAAAPNDPQIRFNVGRMLIARGQFTDAIAELDPLNRATTRIAPVSFSGSRRHTSWRATASKVSGMRSRRGTLHASEGSENWPTPSSGNWRS